MDKLLREGSTRLSQGKLQQGIVIKLKESVPATRAPEDLGVLPSMEISTPEIYWIWPGAEPLKGVSEPHRFGGVELAISSVKLPLCQRTNCAHPPQPSAPS